MIQVRKSNRGRYSAILAGIKSMTDHITGAI
jgi:hypothetical protein